MRLLRQIFSELHSSSIKRSCVARFTTSAREQAHSSSPSNPTYHTASQLELSQSEAFKNQISKLPKITQIPLSENIPWLPQPTFSSASESDVFTRVTVLDNGIRVASEPKFGSFCTVGVVLDSGSRYEVAHLSGISHFLEKLAFGNTVNMKTEEIMDNIEKLGGICDCQTLRDAVIYAASVERRGLERIVHLMSEVVWRPLISQQEFEMAQMAVSFDLENLQMRPEKEILLMEMIHKAAYRDNTVGLPKLCPAENITSIELSKLLSYLKSHHSADRLVVAGVGVDHDDLVKYTERYFKSGSEVWSSHSHLLHPKNAPVDSSVAQYTGGTCLEEADLSKVSMGLTPLPELCHLVVGLESVSHQHADFVSCCLLNVLMGGGGSFSAGGPGKGMYTRLYTNALNKHHWMYNAVAFNHAYLDTGLFCILASAPPSHMHELAQVLTKELVAMSQTITEEELQRAKKQLQSLLLMNLESRPVIFEDLARQVLATGTRKQARHFIQLIDSITVDDMHRVASSLLRSKLSLAAYGSLAGLPTYDAVQAALLDSNGKLRSRSSMFFW